MMRRFRAAAAVFIGLTLSCALTFAQSPAAPPVQDGRQGATGGGAAIKEQGQKVSSAFLSGDFEALLDSTYPKILELAGGRGKMLAVLKSEVAKWEAQKIKIVSYEVGEPGEVKSAGAKLVAVVPTEMKMEVPGALYTQKSFMLAVSADGGKVWKFISGSHLNEAALKLLVPEAVGVVSLPKEVEPVVEKKP
jgi:hypothetical protein